MSYTMTLDTPQKTAEYVERNPRLRRDLNAIFNAVAMMRMNEPEDGRGLSKSCADDAMARWDELVASGHGRLECPCRFNRADAYEVELGWYSCRLHLAGVIHSPTSTLRSPFERTEDSKTIYAGRCAVKVAYSPTQFGKLY